MSRVCPACRHPVPQGEEVRFCEECGTRFPEVVTPTVRVCASCGQRMRWVKEHERQFCDACTAYHPFHEVAIAVVKVPDCRACGNQLIWDPPEQRYHCATCRAWQGGTAAVVATCPTCSQQTRYVAQYQRNWCDRCGVYLERVIRKPVAEVTAVSAPDRPVAGTGITRVGPGTSSAPIPPAVAETPTTEPEVLPERVFPPVDPPRGAFATLSMALTRPWRFMDVRSPGFAKGGGLGYLLTITLLSIMVVWVARWLAGHPRDLPLITFLHLMGLAMVAIHGQAHHTTMARFFHSGTGVKEDRMSGALGHSVWYAWPGWVMVLGAILLAGLRFQVSAFQDPLWVQVPLAGGLLYLVLYVPWYMAGAVRAVYQVPAPRAVATVGMAFVTTGILEMWRQFALLIVVAVIGGILAVIAWVIVLVVF